MDDRVEWKSRDWSLDLVPDRAIQWHAALPPLQDDEHFRSLDRWDEQINLPRHLASMGLYLWITRDTMDLV